MISSFLKKAIAVVLLLCILLTSSVALISCGGGVPPANPDDVPPSQSPTTQESYLDKLIKPDYKDYGRGTVDFSNIVYTRPNITAINETCDAFIKKVEAGNESYAVLLDELIAIDGLASNVLTAYSFARIYSAKDSSLEYWAKEYEYISKNYSTFVKHIEDMKVACANSEYASNFEADIFGAGFVKNYKDGSSLSEEGALLLADEATLIAEYNAISTANTEITYLGKTDTVDNILSLHKEKYGETAPEYLAAESSCMTLYYEKYYEKSKLIFIDLVKIRSKIAEESGYENYIEYCYAERDLDYTPEDTSKLLSDIAEYVVPVYVQLYYYVFYYYFSSTQATQSSFDATINTAYEVIEEISPELHSIFSYMLQHGLFDVESSDNKNRDAGAFTIYLHDYNAPFLFMTGSENLLDYSTLFHEFGHFADFYLNNGRSSSTDTAEISSQALEMLVLDELSKSLGQSQETYLLYNSFKEVLETLANQGFYARFEELTYKLSYDEISEAKLNEQIAIAAREFSINSEYISKLEDILIPHFISKPLYVHSYCTSVIPAAEIYFLEEETDGAGLEAYMSILKRDNSSTDFLTLLEDANLTSPFEKNYMKELADKIHYRILGSHYYESEPPSQVA